MRPVTPARIQPLFLPAIPIVVSVLALTAGRPAPDRGKEIFDTVCSSCHTLTPPPLKAPPMVMIAGHYVQASESEEAARKAMMRWIPAPDTARSLLPDHAVERFGQMAPLPLPSEDVDAVVNYVFSEWQAARTPEPRCEGPGCGDGMMHRRGTQSDSNMQGMMHRRGTQPDSNMQGMMHRHGMQSETGAQDMMCRRGMQSETGAQNMMCGGNCACGIRSTGGQ